MPELAESLDFRELPDIRAELRATVDDEGSVWMEWAMAGTRSDGTRMELVGMNRLWVEDGVLKKGRIYTDLVRDAGGLEAQVDRMTGA